jgi:hypothetical protein
MVLRVSSARIGIMGAMVPSGVPRVRAEVEGYLRGESSSRGIRDSETLTPRVLARERGSREGKGVRALIYERLIVDIIFIEL